MAYWFDLDVEQSIYIKSLERSEGEVLSNFFIAEAESYSDEEKLKLPDIVRVDREKGLSPAEFPSVFGVRGAGYLLFSEQLKDALIKLEPGVHDFISVEIREFPKPLEGDDNVLAIYYMWYSPPAIEAINQQLSCYIKGFGVAARTESLGYLSSIEGEPCILRSSVLKGRHCWREIYRQEIIGSDKTVHIGRRFSFFCSAEFHSVVKFGGFSGFDFLKRCELK